ncbi:MAG: hypothetical protein ACMUIP_12435 [bacterium]
MDEAFADLNRVRIKYDDPPGGCCSVPSPMALPTAYYLGLLEEKIGEMWSRSQIGSLPFYSQKGASKV